MTEDPFDDDLPLPEGEWPPDGPEDDWPAEDSHRRRRLRRIALVVAVAVAAVPLWNVVDAMSPQFADNGLEVCTFDYCQVEEIVEDAGYRLAMARLSEERLSDAEAQVFVDRLTPVVGAPPVTVRVLDDLPGDIGGRYLAGERLIQVRRPATGWILIHEVAHAVAPGHGDDFEAALLDLVEWVEGRRSG